jgi:hypothetical protein
MTHPKISLHVMFYLIKEYGSRDTIAVRKIKKVDVQIII